jgi:hypothetical protein
MLLILNILPQNFHQLKDYAHSLYFLFAVHFVHKKIQMMFQFFLPMENQILIIINFILYFFQLSFHPLLKCYQMQH